VDFEVRRGSLDDVDRLKPLWQALRDHHATLAEMGPVRSVAASWERRRAQYLEWLAGEAHTLLLAERDGEPIGYAVVSVESHGPATWDVGDRVAEIETLSVLDSERGAGVGRALTEASLETAGADAVFVGVAHTNEAAIRFYEREGFEPFYTLMIRRS
jgi:ribosomal protein S18 acetylase RimI-like enzyme